MGQARDGMLSNLGTSVFSKAIIWLAAVGLSFPPSVSSACGCSSDSPGSCCQVSNGCGQMQSGAGCCRHHQRTEFKSCWGHHRAAQVRKCCRSTAQGTSERPASTCNCGPHCMCGRSRVPAPPAVPARHDPDRVDFVGPSQNVASNSCGGADLALDCATPRPADPMMATTSLGRCIDLCRLTL